MVLFPLRPVVLFLRRSSTSLILEEANKNMQKNNVTNFCVAILLFSLVAHCKGLKKMQVMPAGSEWMKLILQHCQEKADIIISLKSGKTLEGNCRTVVKMLVNNKIKVRNIVKVEKIGPLSVDAGSKVIRFKIKFADGRKQTISSSYSKKLSANSFELNSGKKYRATLIDGSIMEGQLVQYDHDAKEITLKTKTREYNISGEKLSKLEEFVISVRLKLKDGNERVGNLIEDKGGKITIKTILGVETYSRKEVRKIEYIK